MEKQVLKYSQNFLKSPAFVRRLIEMSGMSKDQTVLEIGPGKGKIRVNHFCVIYIFLQKIILNKSYLATGFT